MQCPTLRRCAPLAATLVLVTSTLQGTSEAQVLNPANGHYYQLVVANVDWPTASQTATSMSFLGVQGHLATVTDFSEESFIEGLGLPDRVWIGAFQDVNDPAYSEPAGGWKWVTGEPFVYTDWSSGEPNNAPHNENALEIAHGGTRWNDISEFFTGSLGFVVEWAPSSIGSSYCVPAVANSTGGPASLVALGSAMVADDAMRLRATGLPVGAFGYFLSADATDSVPQAGTSQGTLCLGGNIGRFVGPSQVQSAGPDGIVELQVGLSSMPTPTGLVQVVPGQVWYFQAWYRDANPGPTSNFSDAVNVQFQ